jgi:hypothetical protein
LLLHGGVLRRSMSNAAMPALPWTHTAAGCVASVSGANEPR